MTSRPIARVLLCLALLAPLVGCDLVADRDGDGVADSVDLCPRVADASQRDADRNGVGDACECGDLDRDGRVDAADLELLASCAVGGLPCPGLCDVTADGRCDASDALRLEAYLSRSRRAEALVCEATRDLVDPAVAAGLIEFDPEIYGPEEGTREPSVYAAREVVRSGELEIAIDSSRSSAGSGCGLVGCGGNKVSNGFDGTAEYPFGPFTLHDWHPAIGPNQLANTLTAGGYRVVDIEPAESLFDGVFSAVYVKNSGEHMAPDHQWRHDATLAELVTLAGSYRFTSMRPYDTSDGVRFAASMVLNEGNNAKGWAWYHGTSLEWIEAEVEALGHRLVDIERYQVGGSELWAGVAIANTGDDQRDTAVRRFPTPAAALLWHASWPEDRFVDVERDGTDIVAILSSAAPDEEPVQNLRDSWLHFDVAQNDLAHLVRRHGGRVIDVDPLGGGRYDVVLVDNGTPTTGEPRPGYAVFDELVIDKMKRYGLPGATFAISANGNLVYARGYGYADIGMGQLATPDSLVRMGSISKAVTAVAVMRLLESGVTIPGTGASGWLSGGGDNTGGGDPVTLQTKIFRDIICPHYGRQCLNLTSISLEDVLRHEGGWYEQGPLYAGDDFDAWLPLNLTHQVAQGLGWESTPRCKQVLEYFLPRPLDVQPGTKYYYSGLGICAAAVLIEILTGESYIDYVLDEVAGPLQLNQGKTRFAYSPDRYADKVALEARAYDPFGAPKVVPNVVEWAESFSASGWPLFPNLRVPAAYGGTPQYSIVPAGGWSASAVAMLRLATALQHDRRPYVISGASSALFPTPGVTAPGGGHRGLGFGLAGDGGIAHGGSVGGGSAYLRIGGDDVSGISWVLMFNGQPYPSMSGIQGAIEDNESMILGHTWDEFPDYGFEEPDGTPGGAFGGGLQVGGDAPDWASIVGEVGGLTGE